MSTPFLTDKFVKRGGWVLAGILLAMSLYVRLDGIAQNEFFYYDEGYYFTKQRAFDEFIERQQPLGALECLKGLQFNFLVSLCTDKPLWFFLLHLRGLWGGFDDFFIGRILSAVFGLLTVGLTYLFALRHFQSRMIAATAAVLLAFLPGHVFYSRLGLQEALSALCLLTAFYFYLYPNRFGWRSIAAGVFFALSYFSNYRMLIIPALALLAEAVNAWEFKHFNWRRLCWSMVVFGVLIVAGGVINDSCHFKFVFHWMVRQAGSAKDHFDWLSMLSYPYMLLRLEGLLFGALLFSNCLFIRKHKKELLPFFLVLLQMIIFSFAHEKGARYLAVVMPFMAMAAAFALDKWLRLAPSKTIRTLLVIAAAGMVIRQVSAANEIRSFRSDYREAIQDILREDPSAKALSTQAFVQNLFAPTREAVEEPPHRFVEMIAYSQQGYGYVLLDPQAYISYTKSDRRFDPPLEEHLEYMLTNMQPVREYEHFSPAMLERFVFEHNVKLSDSLRFLRDSRDKHHHKIRVYRTRDYVEEVIRRVQYRNRLNQRP